MVVVPVIRLLNQSYYDNEFEYIKVENVTGEIARKYTYYNSTDKTVEIQLNQDLVNSIIKDNFESMGIEVPGGTVRDLMFNTENQRLYVNIKYGMLKLPLSFKINVSFPDTGVKITGTDVHLGKSNAPGFIKNRIPDDIMTFEVNFEEMNIPAVFTVDEVRFRPGIVAVKAQLLSDKIAELAIDYRDNVIDEVESFKGNQSPVLQTFIDRVMETDVLSENKIKEYVEGILSNEEVVNSAIHFAMADDLDKYAQAVEENADKIAEWASPLQAVKFYGSVDETVENILYNEELRELATWFVPVETINEYTATAEDFYGTWKETQTFAQSGDYESSIESMLDSDSVLEVMSWIAPRETAEKYLADAREYYGVYTSVKPLVESGNYEEAAENIIYSDSVEKLLSQFAPEEDVSELMTAADEAYKIYKSSAPLVYDGKYEQALEYLVHDDSVSSFMSRFAPDDYVEDIRSTAAEAYEVYRNSKPLFVKGNYPDALERIMYDEKTEKVLRRILPGGVLDEFYNAKNQLDSTVESMDIELVSGYADLIRDYLVQAESTRKLTEDEISRINTDDLEEVFTYLENDSGKAGEYIRSIDPVYYENFKSALQDATWLKNTIYDYVASMDFSTAGEYEYVVNEVKGFLSLLHNKDYFGAIEMLAYSETSELLADIAEYYT